MTENRNLKERLDASEAEYERLKGLLRDADLRLSELRNARRWDMRLEVLHERNRMMDHLREVKALVVHYRREYHSVTGMTSAQRLAVRAYLYLEGRQEAGVELGVEGEELLHDLMNNVTPGQIAEVEGGMR